MYKNLKNYLQDRSGNYALMFALGSLAILTGVGAAIDINRLHSEKSRAQFVADAAVLQAVTDFKQNLRTERAKTQGRNFGTENLTSEQRRDGDYTVGVSSERLDDGAFRFTSYVEGVTQHSFMGIFGRNETKWTATSESEYAVENAEITLVIDVSHSMKWNGKLEAMKTAVSDFVTNIEPYRTNASYLAVSILPFAENVNFGASAARDWLLTAEKTNPQFSSDFYGCFRHSMPAGIGSLRAMEKYTHVDSEPYPIAPGVNQSLVPTCPPESARATLFDTRERNLSNNIRGMEMGWGTGTGVAMRWAERLYDPAWRNKMEINGEFPPVLTSNTRKYIVLFTDGRIIHTDQDQNGVHDKQPGGITGPLPVETALAKFNAACEDIKDNRGGINVYTIGYDVTGKIPGDLETALTNCATGTGRFYESGTEDLSDIFSEIQADVQSVALTR